MIFIGDIFFEATKADTASELNARSLDAVQTLGALERVHTVKFKVGDIIYALALAQAFSGNHFINARFFQTVVKFTGFEPHTLSDFWGLYSRIDDPRQCPSPQITMSELPKLEGGGALTQPPASQTHLNVHKNRGRRVSFGAIRAIPTPNSPSIARSDSNSTFESLRESETGFNSLKLETSDAQLKPFKMSPCQSASEDESDATDSKTPTIESSDPITEYVDDIVRKAIDEVLVSD